MWICVGLGPKVKGYLNITLSFRADVRRVLFLCKWKCSVRWNSGLGCCLFKEE